MAAPRNNSYRVESGRGVYAGARARPDALLNLFVAARAAVAPTEWTWVQATTNRWVDAVPPIGLRDPFNAAEAMNEVLTDWPVFVFNSDDLTLDIPPNGGHSSSGWNGVMRWSLITRQYSIGYYGARQIPCPAPWYRPADFNSSPPSPHGYGNAAYGRRRKRIYQGYGGVFNTGFLGRVSDPAVPGDQAVTPGDPGERGLRRVGMYEIDMSQAGTGKVIGQTGSNAATGANAGTVLTGANAATLHDWYAPGGPAPVFLGQTLGMGAETAMVWSDEDPTRDVIYWTDGNKWLVRTTINSNNPADDTHELICRSGTAYAGSRDSVQISRDSVRGVVVAITNDQDTNPGCVAFADLKRPTGGSELWRSATLTGNPAHIAEFLALNRTHIGVRHLPTLGKHLIYNGVGRQVYAITTPPTDGATGFTPDDGWLFEKLPMNATQPAPPVTQHTRKVNAGGELIVGVNGGWQEVLEVGGAMVFIEASNDPDRHGNVWWLLPSGWNNPGV